MENEEPSPLEYARKNGLAIDHRIYSTHSNYLAMLQDKTEFDADLDLPAFNFGPGVEVKDHLVLSRDGASALMSASQAELPHQFEATLLSLLDSRRGHAFRLETPLLETDHELDCIAFRERDWLDTKLQDIGLPLETVNEEQNEGLEWTVKYREASSEIIGDLCKEKLAVNKDTFKYLQGTIGSHRIEGENEQLWATIQTYKKVHSLVEINHQA
jgi:hypothetical protein